MAAGSKDLKASCCKNNAVLHAWGLFRKHCAGFWNVISLPMNKTISFINTEHNFGQYGLSRSIAMIFARIKNIGLYLALMFGGVAAVISTPAFAQASLQQIEFVSLPDSRFDIELTFSSAPPVPEVFVIDDPARLTMDFVGVTSQLTERRYPLNYSSADSVMILEAQGRTRMVVNLTSPTPYTTRVQGNTLVVTIGNAGGAAGALSAAQPAQTNSASREFVTPQITENDIAGVDFRRGDDNGGQIIIDLARDDLDANVRQNGTRLEVQFNNAEIAADQQMRLDVTDFATPVQSVSMFNEDNSVMVVADVTGQYEYVAMQDAGQYVLNIIPIVAAASATTDPAAAFSGERISLNFQDIEVRALLQILADFNDFSLVVGDNVSGNITMRLDNVPWDQALDMVLRSRGLDKRLVGTVLYVAPAAEIAATELQLLQSTQQTEELAPLVTEYIEVNYAIATDILTLLQGENGNILTDRGSAAVDARTNTLIVQDIESVIANIKNLLVQLDVPVRQVLIEARIVNASTSFNKGLGIRWGGGQTFPGAGDQFVLTGGLNSSIDLGKDLADIAAGGEGPATVLFNDALGVDLGIASSTSQFAIGYAGNSGLLQLELSALEASGNGEVIAQPKVTTQDQQTATISSGLQIPYQAQAGGTAGGSTVEFITAALSLEVTPQITPDGRIIMILDIHQDSVVPGPAGSVPAIATNIVTTRVLVNDGDTIVLGGVFRDEVTTNIAKTPVLGDLPYLGNLFKRTENTQSKTELLIFITPSIMNDFL
jgi:type IV pilus assembly protein PilQ